MITVVEYLVIAAVIGAAMFGIAVFVFGRGEQMAPLPARTSPSELPASGIHGDHVRDVRFGLALRGYRMSDVDWTLERLADEIDALRSRLTEVTDTSTAGSTDDSGSADDSSSADNVGLTVESGSASSTASESDLGWADVPEDTTAPDGQRSLSSR